MEGSVTRRSRCYGAASDLLPIFDTPLGKRVVLAGDLNMHTGSRDKAELARTRPILELLEAFGLRNLVEKGQD
jgi:endonuclease/exonuclease/phosphatase family metal-dependent hydrolase